jgi:hypothetical protein
MEISIALVGPALPVEHRIDRSPDFWQVALVDAKPVDNYDNIENIDAFISIDLITSALSGHINHSKLATSASYMTCYFATGLQTSR